MRQDLRFALRAMRTSPGFTGLAVLTLAAGIAANTTVFSLISGVLLRQLPYREPDRLVTILDHGTSPVAPADFLDWQRESRSFERMAAAGAAAFTLEGRDRTEQLVGLQLSGGMLELLGVAPLHGRAFRKEEFEPGGDRVVLLSYGLWQRRFGGSLKVVGARIRINGAPHTVAGVMPPGFRFSPFWITEAELWSPLTMTDKASRRGGEFLRVFARLNPGVPLERARAEIETISGRLARAYPETNAGRRIQVDPLHEQVVGRTREALLALAGAVACVLAIACANLAGLSLARAIERRKEIAIRLALGAGRAQILRQLLVESVLLSTAGGALGTALAFWGVRALRLFILEGSSRFASRLPRVHELGVDGWVLGFSALISILTGIAFGLAPAIEALRNGSASLKEGGRGSREGHRSGRLRGVLVASQIAISLVLLAGAGLLVRSFLRMRAIDPGFDARSLLTMTVSLEAAPRYSGPARDALYRRVVDAVEALPGIESASMTNHLPVGGDVWGGAVLAEGRPLPRPGEHLRAVYRVCRPGYFRTMRIPLREGREFSDRDDHSAPRVVVINERLARLLWPSETAVGKRLTADDPRGKPEWLTVAGVVANVVQRWSEDPEPEFYIPFQQDRDFLAGRFRSMTLVTRTSSEPRAGTNAVRAAIAAIGRDVAVSEIRSGEQVVGQALWQARFHLLLLGAFAAFALALAAVGIYGLMAYSVSRRSHEIGIRMALGARRGAVLWLVLRQALVLVLAGAAAGLAAALAATRWLASMLYQVSATDPATLAAAPLALAAVAVLASLWPARRASGVDPAAALRSE